MKQNHTMCSRPPKKHFCLFLIIPMVYEKKKLNIQMVYEKKIKKWNANGCKWREWQQTQMDDNTSHDPAIFLFFCFCYKFLVGIYQ